VAVTNFEPAVKVSSSISWSELREDDKILGLAVELVSEE
jgi:hypothetical protein